MKKKPGLDFKTMFLMAVATSIDALAVGITFACVPLFEIIDAGALPNTLLGVLIIGITTLILSCAGVKGWKCVWRKIQNQRPSLQAG